MYSLRPTMASGTLHSSVSAEDPTLQTKRWNMKRSCTQCSCPLQRLQVYFLFFLKWWFWWWWKDDFGNPTRCKTHSKVNTIPLLGQGSQLCAYGCEKRKRQWVARNYNNYNRIAIDFSNIHNEESISLCDATFLTSGPSENRRKSASLHKQRVAKYRSVLFVPPPSKDLFFDMNG